MPYRIRTSLDAVGPNLDIEAETQQEAEAKMLAALQRYYGTSRPLVYVRRVRYGQGWKLEYGHRSEDHVTVRGYVVLYP